MLKTNLLNNNYYVGFIYGIFLMFCQFQPNIGLPLILGGSIVYFSWRNIPKFYTQIFTIILLKIIIISSIFLLFKFQYGLSYLAFRLSPDLIFITLLFFKPPIKFTGGFMNGIFVIFLLNLLFNIYSFFTGSDPFGREILIRTNENIPRFGGIFGHPYLSSYLNLITLLFAIFKRNKFMIFLSSVLCLFTGSLRSWAQFFSLIFTYISLKLKLKKSLIITILITFSTLVIISTFLYDTSAGNFTSGNAFRVFAWQNAIQRISENPLIGYHGFSYFSFDGNIDPVSYDIVLNLGIAENQYLQYMQDFGIIVGILHLLLMYKMLNFYLEKYYKDPNNNFYFLQATLVCLAFGDSFYGGILENIFMCAIFSVIIFHKDSKEIAI